MRPDEVAVEAELVAEGARQLRQQVGHPDKQRAIIRAMDEKRRQHYADGLLSLIAWPGSLQRACTRQQGAKAAAVCQQVSKWAGK